MPFKVFGAKGSSQAKAVSSNFPFQVIIENVKSGVSATDFRGKCPCDTGNAAYTSAAFFTDNTSYPTVKESGALAFKVYSGSNVYREYELDNPNIVSYPGATAAEFNKVNCEDEKDESAMRVYGLNKSIFITDFFPQGSSDTLKVWLTVCFPSGQPETAEGEFKALDKNNKASCYSCEDRANTPMVAFVSCGIKEWPKAVVSALINKGTPEIPRYEKRQIQANIPIAEITASGQIVRQLCSSNLVLTDMCIQGIPCKFPISSFG